MGAQNVLRRSNMDIYDYVIKFSGAGWLFPFHFGVAQQLREMGINFGQGSKVKVGGVSAGSVVAAMLLLGVDFEVLLQEILNEYPRMKYNPFRIRPTLRDVLANHVTNDIGAYNGRLVVGVSFFDIFKRVWRSETVHSFVDKGTCIDALKASCHIPFICGLRPCYVNGIGYYDGELADFNASEMGPTRHGVEVGICVKPGTINPGIHLPELWKYYPLDPFVLRQLYRLGVLRTKQHFNSISRQELVEISKITDLLLFCARSNVISYMNRVLVTLLMKATTMAAVWGAIYLVYTASRWVRRNNLLAHQTIAVRCF